MTQREWEAIDRDRLRRYWARECVPISEIDPSTPMPGDWALWRRGIWQTTPSFVR